MKKLLVIALMAIIGVVSTLAAQTPVSSTEYTGTKITLAGEAQGTTPITFAWFKNDVQVATGANLVFNAIALTDAGTYKLRATNNWGTADSDALVIVVVTPVAPNQVKIQIIRG
jgi:hypothetical protein